MTKCYVSHNIKYKLNTGPLKSKSYINQLTSMILAPARSCMMRLDVTIGEIPSSINVPLLLARITRIQ